MGREHRLAGEEIVARLGEIRQQVVIADRPFRLRDERPQIEVHRIERHDPAAPDHRCAADLPPGGVAHRSVPVGIEVRRVAQGLRRWVESVAAAFDEQRAQAGPRGLERQHDACRTGADDADVGNR